MFRYFLPILLTTSLFGQLDKIELFSTTHKTGVASSSDILVLNWSKPENSEISQYRYILNNSNLNSLSESGKRLTSSYNSLTLPLNELEDGDYYFHLVAESVSLEISPETILGKIVIDRNPPTTYISETKMENGSVRVILTSIEDNVDIYYSLDGEEPDVNSQKYEEPIYVFTDTEISFLGVDQAGNKEESKTKDISVSYRGNIADLSLESGSIISTNGESGANNPISHISISADDLKAFKYQINSQEFSGWLESSETIYIGNLENGEHKVVVYGKDSLENIQPVPTEVTFFVDNEKPTLTASIDNNKIEDNNSFSSSVVVTFQSNENGFIRYTLDGTIPSKTAGSIYTNPINISKSTIVKTVAVDTLGNIGNLETFNIKIDRESPEEIKAVVDNEELNVSHFGYLNGNFIFSESKEVDFLVSEDETAYWTIDGTTPNMKSKSGSVIIDETTTLKFLGADEVGNSTPVETRNIVIDKIPPQIRSVKLPDSCQFISETWVCSDSLISFSANVFEEETPTNLSVHYTINGDKPTKESSNLETGKYLSLSTGSKKVKIVAYDWVGNESQIYELDIRYERLITQPFATFSILSGDHINSEKTQKITMNIDDGGAEPFFFYRFKNQNFEQNTSSYIDISKLDDGEYSIYVIISNGEKNSTTYNKTFTVDNIAPVEPVISGENNFTETVDISISLQEDDDDVDILYSKNSSIISLKYRSPITIGETTTIYAKSRDKAGNESSIVSEKFEKYIEYVEPEPEPEPDEPEQVPEPDDINETIQNETNETVPEPEPEPESPPQDLGNLVVQEKSWGELVTIESSRGIEFETITVDFNSSNDSVSLANSADGSRSYTLAGTKTIIKPTGNIEVDVGEIDFVSRSSDDENISLDLNGFYLSGNSIGFEYFTGEWLNGVTIINTDRLSLVANLYDNEVVLNDGSFSFENTNLFLEVTRDEEIKLNTEYYTINSNELITENIEIESNRIFLDVISGRYGLTFEYKNSSIFEIESNSSEFTFPELVINAGDNVMVDITKDFGDNIEVTIELPVNSNIEF
jgi:hypothetical protein